MSYHPSVQGRFVDDLHVVLEYSPTEKKPWRVRVWVWNEHNDMWMEPGVLDKYYHAQLYRNMDKALNYMYKVKRERHRRALVKQVWEKHETTWEVIG